MFTLNIFTITITSAPTEKDNIVSNSWRQIENLVTNIQYLITSGQNDTRSLHDWLADVERMAVQMQQNKNSSLAYYVDVCDTTVWSLELLYPGKIIDSLHWSEIILETTLFSLQSINDVENLVCILPSMNVTQLIRYWNSSKISEIVKMYVDVHRGNNKTKSFSCDRYIATVTEIISEYENIQSLLPEFWNRIVSCLSKSSKSNATAFTEINRIIDIWKMANQLLKVSPDLKGLFPEGDISLFENFYRAFIEEKPVMIMLEKLWKNSTEVKSLLSDVLSLSPVIINQIMASSINLNQLHDFTSRNITLTRMFCNQDVLNDLLTLKPDLSLNTSMITQTLCGSHLNETWTILSSGLNLTNIMLEFYGKGPEFGLSIAWLQKFVNGLEKLTEDIQLGFELSSMLTDWQKLDLVDFLGTLQTFLNDKIPEKIFEDIITLVDNLRSILNSEHLEAFLDDTELIANGIHSLNVMNKMSFDTPMSSLIKKPSVLKSYMINKLNISDGVTDSILSSSILYKKLAEFRNIDIEALVCSPEELAKLLTFQPETNVSVISMDLCQLTQPEVTHILEYIIQNLKVGEFIKNFISLSPEKSLAKINMSKDETHRMMENLAQFQTQFSDVLKGFTSLMENIEFTSFNDSLAVQAKWRGDISMLGEVLCDHQTAFDVKDNYQLSDTRGSQDVKDKMTDYDKQQLAELPTEFCKEFYLNIKNLDNGHIIWTYMKPLIRGKILYAPQTPDSEAIMSEATKILRDIESIKQLTEMLSSNLNKLDRRNSSLNYAELKKVLDNPFIHGTITETLGFNSNNLLNGLELLNVLEKADIKKMKTLVGLTHNVSECLEGERLYGYASEEQLEAAALEMVETNHLLAGVVFVNLQPENKDRRRKRHVNSSSPVHLNLPKHVKYKIRMDIENTPSTDSLKDRVWRQLPEDDFGTHLRYLHGFIQLQDMIDNAIIKLQTGANVSRPSIDIQQFPYPCYKNDQFQTYIVTYFLPIMMFLAWFVAIASALYNIVYDREQRLEETLSIMGLRNGVSWTGWFINTVLGMLLMAVAITLILKLAKMMPNGNLVIIWLFLADFSLAMTMFCYMISAFFTRASLAILSGIMIYLISYLPFVIIVAMQANMEFWISILFSLSATTAFSYGNQLMSRLELQGPGIQWDNIQTVAWHFSFDWSCYMMLIDAAIYFIIGWYVRHVFPGKYGVGQPWYFCLSRRFWCKGCCCGDKTDQGYMTEMNGASIVLGEPDPVNLSAGIQTNSLHKDFKKRGKDHRIAVNNLTVNFYRGQITALLGENGAGKTTMINMLTGYLRPTSGHAIIEGNSIISDVAEIRRNLGICPQFDVLYHYMTVYEHLDMFVTLKNKGSKQDQKEEIHRMLKMANLHQYMYIRVSKLSGGQRRRLSVVLAFVGGSRVIILDEPTSGIDPCARRAIWNLILENKDERTIILCTHNMDEAEALSDRIVMMHKGNLICCGSSLYLKKHYGSGYHLTINREKLQDVKFDQNGKASLPQITSSTIDILKIILQHVPDAYISEEIGMEMTVALPTDQNQASKFPQMFSDLDSKLNALHIQSYGISDSTLEEVFLRLVKHVDQNRSIDTNASQTAISTGAKVIDSDDENSIDKDCSSITSTDSDQLEISEKASTSSVTNTAIVDGEVKSARGARLKLYQFGSLFVKRFHHHRRDVRSYFSQLFLPVIFMCLAMACTLIKPSLHDLPSTLLVPSMYGPGTTMFFRLADNSDMNSKYVAALLQQPGIGTTCMADSGVISQCEKDWDPLFHTSAANSSNTYTAPQPCICQNGFEVCPDGASGQPMPYTITPAGNHLYNITGSRLDTDDYLLRSRQEFLHKRYGGWEFGSEAVVWWDNKGWHALPAFYSTLSNMILRANVKQNPGEYGISTYNHPLPKSKEQLSEHLLIQGLADTGIALTIFCAFCFIPAGYVIYLVNERRNKEKRLQIVSGVGLGLYWFTAFFWDMLAYMFTVMMATIITAAFQIPTYNDRLNLAAFVSSLIMFGWCLIPFAYLLVPCYNNAAVGYMMTFIINLMIGILTTSSTFILSVFGQNDVIQKAYNLLSNAFLIFPQYCIGDALIRLSRNQFLTELNDRFHVDSYVNPFSSNMIMWHLSAMACEGFILFVIHFLIEAHLFPRPSCISLHRERMDPNYKEDEDVSLERQRVTSGETNNDLIVLYCLKKLFKKGRQSITAVDNVSLAIPKGQCFGLLGVNGAGKTTTFNMMVGEVTPTAGEALLKGKKISKRVPDMDQRVGYCPQQDALDDNLSVSEVLTCYGRLKGLYGTHLAQVVESLIKKMRLTRFTNKTVKSLSGGTKRKLSTAVALLGKPDVILMDEPTSGMDPLTRRLVWNVITDTIKDNRSIVLTSHSMEECEAVCTRLAIMVNGHLMCLGNQQHIQQKFGNGHLIKLKATDHAGVHESIISYILQAFEGAEIKEHQLNIMEVQVPYSVANLPAIFRVMEAGKMMSLIQDYSVSQTSLDQVFISFAEQQNAGTEEMLPDEKDFHHLQKYAITPSHGQWFGKSPSKGAVSVVGDPNTIVINTEMIV